MYAILSNYIPLLLLFTISISSKKRFLEHEIVPFIHQPTPPVKLNDYFIYPSNDKKLRNVYVKNMFGETKIVAGVCKTRRRSLGTSSNSGVVY